MAVQLNDVIRDNGLVYVQTNKADMKLVLVVGDPTGVSYADLDTNLGTGNGKKVAEVTDLSTIGTVGARAGGGRKITIPAFNGVSVLVNSGAAPDLHIVLLRITGSVIVAFSDETSNQQLTAGNQVNLPAWDIGFPNAVQV